MCVIANLIERFFHLYMSNYYEKHRIKQRNKINIQKIIQKMHMLTYLLWDILINHKL